MKKIIVSKEIIQEAKNIVDGVYAPLECFLYKNEVSSVLEKMRLLNGKIWSMPIFLDISEKDFQKIKNENKIVITDKEGLNEFEIKNIKIYKYDKKYFCQKLFGTSSKQHPGVQKINKTEKYFVGGKVISIKTNEKNEKNYCTPKEIKKIFEKNNWKKVVAFQTRNAPHRSHEYLQKCGLKKVDGLFIQPIIGQKKKGDFQDDHIIEAYKILFKKYFPSKKAMLSTFRTYMRYAGPKEAVFHALIRRNFGCTHMIIGRDHAGVGDFYGSYDAQKIFDNFTNDELGVKILKYDNAAYCKKCGDIVFDRDCPHEKKDKIFLSGTELRRRLLNEEEIPEEFMRTEIKEYLLNNKNNLFVK